MLPTATTQQTAVGEVDEDNERTGATPVRLAQRSVPLKVKNTFISIDQADPDDPNSEQDGKWRRQASEPAPSMAQTLGNARPASFIPDFAGYEGWAQEAVEDEGPLFPQMGAEGEEPMHVQTSQQSLLAAMANLARSVGQSGDGGCDGAAGGGDLAAPNVLGGAAIPPPEWANTTTVMMRNLPNKYTQRMLLTEINHTGFLGTFDFLYLPIDPETTANRGYSFLNFIDPGFAWMFKMSYEGRKMNRFNSNKVVSVVPATLQGFEANYAHYASSRVNRGDPAARPLFFREPKQPLPGAGGMGMAGDMGDVGGGMGMAGDLGMAGFDLGVMGQQASAAGWAGGAAGAGSYLGLDGGCGGCMGSPYPCGGSAPAEPPKPKLSRPRAGGMVPQFCPSCGGKIQPQFQFCPHCGGSLEFGSTGDTEKQEMW